MLQLFPPSSAGRIKVIHWFTVGAQNSCISPNVPAHDLQLSVWMVFSVKHKRLHVLIISLSSTYRHSMCLRQFKNHMCMFSFIVFISFGLLSCFVPFLSFAGGLQSVLPLSLHWAQQCVGFTESENTNCWSQLIKISQTWNESIHQSAAQKHVKKVLL